MPIPPRAPEADLPATRGGAESVIATEETSGPELKAAPQRPFLYVHYPNDPGNWRIGMVDGEPVWLPKLQKHSLTPGVGGVRTLSRGESPEAAYSEALNKIALRDGIALDRRLDYCYRTPCQHPRTKARGFVYHDQFEAPIPPKGRSKRTLKYDTDEAARDAWLLWLIQEGHLQAPDESVIDHNRMRISARIYERAARRGVELPAELPSVEEAVAGKMPKYITAAMEASDVAVEASVPRAPEKALAPAPAKKRTTRKKTTAAKPEKAPADDGLTADDG